jgi:adenosine deaminase
LLDAGIVATINSDDPAYFGGYLNQNWLEIFAALDLDANHARTLALNSVEASFLPDERKTELRAQIDAYCAAAA